jgi:hypothetical protein
VGAIGCTYLLSATLQSSPLPLAESRDGAQFRGRNGRRVICSSCTYAAATWCECVVAAPARLEMYVSHICVHSHDYTCICIIHRASNLHSARLALNMLANIRSRVCPCLITRSAPAKLLSPAQTNAITSPSVHLAKPRNLVYARVKFNLLLARFAFSKNANFTVMAALALGMSGKFVATNRMQRKEDLLSRTRARSLALLCPTEIWFISRTSDLWPGLGVICVCLSR